MFGVAAAELLAYLRVGAVPEAAQVARGLHRTAVRRQQRERDGLVSEAHAGRVGQPEQLLQLDRGDHASVLAVLQSHAAAAGHLQRLRREAAPPEGPARDRFDDLARALRAGIGRLDARVEEFLGLGRPARPAEPISLDPAPLVAEVGEAEGPIATAPPDDPLAVRADRELLAKALANLVRNARQAAPGSAPTVAWRRDGDAVLVEVLDEGPGIPPAEREAIFEPFRTSRPGGTGLGLAIARDAVEAQGGTLVAGESPGGGARFTIRLPPGESR